MVYWSMFFFKLNCATVAVLNLVFSKRSVGVEGNEDNKKNRWPWKTNRAMGNQVYQQLVYPLRKGKHPDWH